MASTPGPAGVTTNTTVAVSGPGGAPPTAPGLSTPPQPAGAVGTGPQGPQGVQAAPSTPASSSTGCDAKGNIFTVPHTSWSFTYCEAKALISGSLIGVGGGVALVGVVLIVVLGIGGKAAKVVVGAAPSIGKVAAKAAGTRIAPA